MVNGPLKNEESRQGLPNSRNLAKPTNGSRSLRFCVCRSHICFSIKSLHFFVLGSDLRCQSRRLGESRILPFATPDSGHLVMVKKSV